VHSHTLSENKASCLFFRMTSCSRELVRSTRLPTLCCDMFSFPSTRSYLSAHVKKRTSRWRREGGERSEKWRRMEDGGWRIGI
jgi:hypothetical protein